MAYSIDHKAERPPAVLSRSSCRRMSTAASAVPIGICQSPLHPWSVYGAVLRAFFVSLHPFNSTTCSNQRNMQQPIEPHLHFLLRPAKRLLLTCSALILLVACQSKQDEIVATHDNGQPAMKRTLRGDVASPSSVDETTFYPNGQVQTEKHFKAQQPTGQWHCYYPNGKPLATANYNRSTTGDWDVRTPDGNPLFQGKTDSTSVDWNDDGSLHIVRFHHADSAYIYQLYANGSIESYGCEVGGQRTGRWSYYYPHGQLLSEAVYISGALNGIYNSYREDGNPTFKGFYIADRRAGVWEFYDASGKLVGTQNYDR